MSIEILAGRITAPYLGVSLYTWTSVLGAVLLGVTGGSYLGGRIADTYASKKALGLSFALAGLFTLLINTLARTFGPRLAMTDWPLWASTALFAMVVFFPAAFFLSMISPQVVKGELKTLEDTGKTIGNIGAWSALGSIVGTFSGGFIFIAFIGTKRVIDVLAVLLLLIGVGVAWKDKIWKRRMSVFIGLLLIGDVMLPGVCRLETPYVCVRTVQAAYEAGSATTTSLYLDRSLRASIDNEHPETLRYAHEYVQAGLADERLTNESAPHFLFIGAGGYAVPRFLAGEYPKAEITVIERDAALTKFVHEAFSSSMDSRIRTSAVDARIFLQRQSVTARYSRIYQDALIDQPIPAHVATQEFFQLIKQHLTPEGMYVVTVADDLSYPKATASIIQTMRQTFSYVYVFPAESRIKAGARRSVIQVVATNALIDPTVLLAGTTLSKGGSTALSLEEWQRLGRYLSVAELEAFLQRAPEASVLTDDRSSLEWDAAPKAARSHNARFIVL